MAAFTARTLCSVSGDFPEEEEDTSDSDTSESEEEDNVDVDVVLQDNVVVNASLDAAKRKSHTHVHSAPTGNYAAFRIPGDIFSLGNKAPWDVVNPMGVHPKDAEKSIFSYDISSLPETEEARPWRAAGAEPRQRPWRTTAWAGWEEVSSPKSS